MGTQADNSFLQQTGIYLRGQGNRKSYPVSWRTWTVHRQDRHPYITSCGEDSMIDWKPPEKRKRMAGISADDRRAASGSFTWNADFKAVSPSSLQGGEMGCMKSSHARQSLLSMPFRHPSELQPEKRGTGTWWHKSARMRLCSNRFISAVDPQENSYKKSHCTGLLYRCGNIEKNRLEVSASISPCPDIIWTSYRQSLHIWRIFAIIPSCPAHHVPVAIRETNFCIYRLERKPFPKMWPWTVQNRNEDNSEKVTYQVCQKRVQIWIY